MIHVKCTLIPNLQLEITPGPSTICTLIVKELALVVVISGVHLVEKIFLLVCNLQLHLVWNHDSMFRVLTLNVPAELSV